MFGADLLLPMLLGYLVQKYSAQWAWNYWVVVMVISFGLSIIMHLTYIEAGRAYPDVATHGGRLTAAGWLHALYMGFALCLIGLFYLASVKPAPSDVWLATVWLVVHVIVGVHVPLKLIKPSWFPYAGIGDAGTLVPIFGATALLIGMSIYALR